MGHTGRSYLLGICGGSASGKSTAVADILKAMHPVSVSVVDQDSYYHDRSHISPPDRERINYDHPDAIDFNALINDIIRLKSGNAIFKPIYDHATHTRRRSCHRVLPAKLIIVEGLHIFYIQEIVELMDYRIFIDIEDDIRFIRRLQRDIKERGRTLESIVSQYLDTVKPMHNKFIEPYKQYADISLSENCLNQLADIVINWLNSKS